MAAPPPLSAIRRVLDTTELLEHILSLSNPLTVLRAESACLRFKNVIAASTKLQRYLYFAADGSTSDTIRRPNELLRNLAVHNNEHILSITDIGYAYIRWSYDRGDNVFDGHAGCYLQLGKIPKPGSCVRMFLAQPPATRVRVYSHRYGYYDGIIEREVVVENEAGVTWGDVCVAIMLKGRPGVEDKEGRIMDAARMAIGRSQD